MDMFEWEPVEDTIYPEAIMATQTAGLFYDVLHVEYDNDGWHAMFLNFGSEEMEMVDEQVHPDELSAQTWAERVDFRHMSKKVGEGQATDEEIEWLAMAQEGIVAGDE